MLVLLAALLALLAAVMYAGCTLLQFHIAVPEPS